MNDYSYLTFSILKFILGYFLLLLTLSSIYYLAPNHKRKFKLLSYGSLFGANVIIVASLIFNYYIVYFATYNQIYGSLAGIIIYMLWLYITSYVLLIGAEINQITDLK
jgi:membrane protein